MALERKTTQDIVNIPLFASIKDKEGFQNELESMTRIFGNACMVVWDELGRGNDVLHPNTASGRVVDVYADSKQIEKAVARLHEDGELSRYMTVFAEKLGALCGHFEDSPLAMRMAPMHDILSTCVINDVATRIDGDIYHNEHLAGLDEERRSEKAQYLAWDVVRTIVDSGSSQYDYDSGSLGEPEEWNFRYMFNQAYVQAMRDKDLPVFSWIEERIAAV